MDAELGQGALQGKVVSVTREEGRLEGHKVA